MMGARGWYGKTTEDVRQRARERSLAYYYAHHDEQLEKQKKRSKDRYHSDPVYRAKAIARAVETQSSKIRNRWDNLKQWRLAHPDELKAQRKRWELRRRALTRLAQTDEIVDLDAVRAAACGMCAICGLELGTDQELDHIVPLSKGGKHATKNLQIVHGTCNRKKGSKLRAS